MTNFYVTYKLASKKDRDDFFNEVKANGIIEKSVVEDGCIRYAYFYPADSETDLFLWEQWENRDAQAKHKQQPHFEKLGLLKAKYSVEADILVEDQIIR